VHDLSEMIGQNLLVHVTYLRADGHHERLEFMGQVVAVTPLVTITRPGTDTPFTLPADVKCYASATPGAYTLDSTGETVFNPRYETTWRVRAPAGSGHDPDTNPFQPKKSKKK
jgi:hypothetical protein